MRMRIAQAGASSLADYELLEVLLFAAIPRRDSKPLAKMLLAEFKTLAGVVEADKKKLSEMGVPPKTFKWLHLPHKVATHLAIPFEKPLIQLTNMADVENYIENYASKTQLKEAYFYVFLLNTRNELLHEEYIELASLDELRGWVLRRVLLFHAAALLILYVTPEERMPVSMVHRHMQWAQSTKNTLKLFDVSLHEYIIYTKGTYRYLLEAVL